MKSENSHEESREQLERDEHGESRSEVRRLLGLGRSKVDDLGEKKGFYSLRDDRHPGYLDEGDDEETRSFEEDPRSRALERSEDDSAGLHRVPGEKMRSDDRSEVANREDGENEREGERGREFRRLSDDEPRREQRWTNRLMRTVNGRVKKAAPSPATIKLRKKHLVSESKNLRKGSWTSPQPSWGGSSRTVRRSAGYSVGYKGNDGDGYSDEDVESDDGRDTCARGREGKRSAQLDEGEGFNRWQHLRSKKLTAAERCVSSTS